MSSLSLEDQGEAVVEAGEQLAVLEVAVVDGRILMKATALMM